MKDEQKKIILFKGILTLAFVFLFYTAVFSASFTLQMGVYNDGNGAEISQKQLKEKNIPTFIIFEENFYRVWYGVFADENDAKKEAVDLKKKGYQVIVKEIPENIKVQESYLQQFEKLQQNTTKKEDNKITANTIETNTETNPQLPKINITKNNNTETENKTPEVKTNTEDILLKIKNNQDLTYLKISVFDDSTTALKLCDKLQNENFFAVVLVKTIQERDYYVVVVSANENTSLYETAQKLQQKNYVIKGYY